ncbi:MAG: methyltransferase [Candidatus Woesearchaeota archaeon]
MDKDEVHSLISCLRNGKNEERVFNRLKKLFEGLDPNVDTKWKRKLINSLARSDNPYSILLLNSLIPKLSAKDRAMLGYAMQAGIELKEFNEARFFYQQVSQIFQKKYSTVYDLCAGNGLNGFYWLMNKDARRVGFYDSAENKNFRRLARNFRDHEYNLGDIMEIDFQDTPEDSAFLSIHACGNLTDRVIGIALSQRKPFAVMPCCYNYHDNPYFNSEMINYFHNPKDAIDACRIRMAEQKGFRVLLRNIPEEVTDMNRIITGIPE